MKVNILYVKDPGVLEKERLVLRALEDIDIGQYIIADTTYQGEGQVSNSLRHIFWPPDRLVSKNDLIVIYTKPGLDNSVKNDSGNRSHFLYWGLERTIWNETEDAATVFKIEDWISKKV